MAIALEYLDLVVPIARIRESYPGGWEQCRRDYAARLGQRVWHDQHLLRDGAMSLEEVQVLVEGWSVLGFQVTGTRNGGEYWKDVCVLDWRKGGATLPCDWLRFDRTSRTAHLAGADAGPLAWRGRPSPVVLR